MRRLLCALAFVLIAAPAWAQGTEDEPEASVGSLATGLIGDADAEGVFEIVPAEHEVAVRHIRSGLVCRMDPNSAYRLIIFPEAARGEDVGCELRDGDAVIKLYATRYSFPTTVAQQVAGATAIILQHYPGARPLQLAQHASANGLPASQSAHFLVRDAAGAQDYTRVSVAMIQGWVIKLRYTAPAADDAAAARVAQIADAVWRQTLSEIVSR
jgi:hypothetical protein